MKAGRTSFAKENRKSIINQILEKGELTRSQLVAETRLSVSNVRMIVEQYLHHEIIEEVGYESSNGGRKAMLLGMNKKRNFILLINNMWDESTYQIYDAAGNIKEHGSLRIHRFDTEDIFHLIMNLKNKYGHILVIGLIVYGVVKDDLYLTGTTAKNWKEITLGRDVYKQFHVPVIMMNDLRAAAFGASHLYADKFQSVHTYDHNMIFLHLSGMGTGAGIIRNGEIHKGFANIAGETGFMPLLDTYADDLFENHETSREKFCELTARYIAILNYIFNPEIVVIGGDYFRDSMLIPIHDHLQEMSPEGFLPTLYGDHNYDELVTCGLYRYLRKRIVDDELWYHHQEI